MPRKKKSSKPEAPGVVPHAAIESAEPAQPAQPSPEESAQQSQPAEGAQAAGPEGVTAFSPTQVFKGDQTITATQGTPVNTVAAGSPTFTDQPIKEIIDRPFPIFLNLNPAIVSISPSGAVVGGSDFTLTVLGSNFGPTSTVTWNQSPRTTTFISNTQLNVAIPASDLATVVTVNVVVSTQGAAGSQPVLSNGVSFTVIPDISDILNQLKAITAIPATLLAELQTYVTIQQSQVDTLTTQVNTDQTTAAGLNSQIANLQTQVTNQQAQITTLTGQVQATQAQSASPMDVAQSFKNVVDQIQQNALSAGGLQSTVTNMNVQVKSLLSVQSATATAPASATLVFPSPTALPDPNHLSTLSFSFGAIPSLKAAGIGGGTSTTPTPAPTPAPSPTPAPAPTPAPSVAERPGSEVETTVTETIEPPPAAEPETSGEHG